MKTTYTVNNISYMMSIQHSNTILKLSRKGTYRDLIEIDVGFLPVGTICSVTGLLVEPSTKLQKISHNHGIHYDDEYKRHNQTCYTVDNANDLHGLQVLDLEFAYLVAALILYHPGGDEGV